MKFLSNYNAFTRSAAIISIATGSAVVFGWIFNIDLLKSILPNYSSMKFNTALCFIFSGLSLSFYGQAVKKRHFLPLFFSLATILISGISLSEDIFQYDAGIDQLIIADRSVNTNLSFNYPGRMASATSFCFCLLGLSLPAAKSGYVQIRIASQFAFHAITIISAIAIIGYLYKVPVFYRLSFLTSVAIHTSIVFFVVSIGASFINFSLGITGLFTGHHIGSMLARRLFPVLTVILVLLGFLRMELHRKNLISVEFGIALFALSFILVSLLLISIYARRLNKTDITRNAAEQSLFELNKNLELIITERSHQLKDTIDKLKKNEEKFRGLLEAAPDAMIIVNEEGEIQLINQQTEKLLHYTPSELAGSHVELLIPEQHKTTHPHWRNSFAAHPKAREMGEGKELFARKKNGEEIPVEISLSPLQTENGLLIIASLRDITTRKKAEEKIRAGERQFRVMLETIGDNAWEHDFITDKTVFSPNIEKLLGYTNNDMHDNVGLWWRNTHDEDRWMLLDTDKKYRAGLIDKHTLEYRIHHKNGSLKWVLDRGVVIEKDKDNKPLRIVGTHTDITDRKNLEIRLSEEKRKYRGIFNSANQFIGLLSPEGILLEVNNTALLFGGIKAEDVIGKPIWETSWCKTNPGLFKTFFDEALKGELIRENVQVMGKNQELTWIDFTLKAIYDEAGDVSFLIPEGRDINQQLLLQNLHKEQEEKIRLFVKYTPAAVAMFDTEMKYIIASDRWYTEYGLEGRDIIGQSHYDVFPEISNPPEWIDIHQRCLKGSIEKNDESPFPRTDGTIDWIHWEIHPWHKHDGSIGGIIMFTEVITEKVNARENLKKLYQELLVSNDELEQFAYIASHDLQEPLRMVSSFLQLLEKKYKPRLDETAGQYIHFAVDGAERMKALIKDLLAFSRVGSIKQEFESVDVKKVLEETALILGSPIEESGAVIRYGQMPVIRADRIQITQLFQNLIGNAIKYAGDKNPVVEICCKENDRYWIFSIKDNGIGISAKYFEKIFVVFQRLHTRSSYSGTGIGLAICKKIVEKHEGRIWVESTEGQGSTFNFTISKNIR